MSPKQKGLLVNRIAPTCAVAKLLEVGDVLLSFDKEPIANDGTVVYRKHERVAFSSLAQGVSVELPVRSAWKTMKKLMMIYGASYIWGYSMMTMHELGFSVLN